MRYRSILAFFGTAAAAAPGFFFVIIGPCKRCDSAWRVYRYSCGSGGGCAGVRVLVEKFLREKGKS